MVDSGGPPEPDAEPEQPFDTITLPTESAQESQPVHPGGRRRGRRRVMRKKTIKDEEGYLGKHCAFSKLIDAH